MTTTAIGTRSAELGRRSESLHSDKKITPVGGSGTHLSALRAALEHHQNGRVLS
jgi:hypothetical protein